MRSFYLTDRNTPILGAFCSVGLGFVQKKFDPLDDPHRIRTWTSLVPLDVQYPNDVGSWADEFFALQCPTFDVLRFATWLSKVRSIANCLSPPMCAPQLPCVMRLPVVMH
jgi:hypothetical protein